MNADRALPILGLLAGLVLGPPAGPQAGSAPPQRPMADLQPRATFTVGGNPDWMAVSEDAVWVSVAREDRVTELLAESNTLGRSLPVENPCSGLAAGFGSLWIPSCGRGALLRAGLASGRIEAVIPAAPADPEGCIAVGAGSVWMMTGRGRTLARIDPAKNAVVRTVRVPGGSYCPVFAEGFLWVTSTRHNLLAKIDPAANRVVARIPVGRGPRFATAGGGAVWTLNQGDGTVSRVDVATGKVAATVPAGLSGHGGEIAFGFGAVWATLLGTPVTRIDAGTNAVLRQWIGPGGDSIRTGLGSVWLTDLKGGRVWRIPPDTL